MSEEKEQEQGLEVQAQADQEDKPEQALEALKELKELVERQKQEIAGLNRRNSEEQKRLAELQKQHMTEEERKQAEMAEIQRALINEFKENTLLKRNIPLEMAGLVQGKSKDEIESGAALLAKYREEIESKTKSKLEELEKELGSLKLKTTITGEPKTGQSGKIDKSKLSIDEATRLYKEGKL